MILITSTPQKGPISIVAVYKCVYIYIYVESTYVYVYIHICLDIYQSHVEAHDKLHQYQISGTAILVMIETPAIVRTGARSLGDASYE